MDARRSLRTYPGNGWLVLRQTEIQFSIRVSTLSFGANIFYGIWSRSYAPAFF